MATFEYVKVGDGVTQWSALPYVAGFPGPQGTTGPTGLQGSPGVSGGLTLQLDFSPSATYVNTPLVGSLITTFDSSTQTTITIPAATSYAVVGTFSIAANALPGTTAVSGFWDLNLYALVANASLVGKYYFDVYDNSTLVAAGSSVEATNIDSTTYEVYTNTLLSLIHI